MSLKDEFRKMVNELTNRFPLPAIANIFFPPFYKSGQSKNSQFMAIGLEGGTVGVSYVFLPDQKMKELIIFDLSQFLSLTNIVPKYIITHYLFHFRG
jgi:hypothetical protein